MHKLDCLWIPTEKDPVVRCLGSVGPIVLVWLFKYTARNSWCSGHFIPITDVTGCSNVLLKQNFTFFLFLFNASSLWKVITCCYTCLLWWSFQQKRKAVQHNHALCWHSAQLLGSLAHAFKLHVAIPVSRCDSCACLHDHSCGRLPHLWTSCIIRKLSLSSIAFITTLTNACLVYCPMSLILCRIWIL